MAHPKPLSLRVPEPAVRPEGLANFSYVHGAEAGSVRRPPIDDLHADLERHP